NPPIISDRLNSVKNRGALAFCPAHHNTNTPALSISQGADGRLLFYCHAGCPFSAICDALRDRGLLAGTRRGPQMDGGELTRLQAEALRKADKRAQQARATWDEARPIESTVAEFYLRNRAITCALPDTLRFHLACWHPSGQRLPAMVALVQGAERFAVHRTFLRADGTGKAEKAPAKAMLGTVAGGAVRLTTGNGTLVVAEGIETALSLASGLLRAPATIWSTLSTSGMSGLRLPAKPGRLTIATDGDGPGQAAGNALAERAVALGWTVSLLPAPHGRDWNDILKNKEVAA
ncbi:DUF7146 domain-containing protein, partial [Haematobacter missouriensis]|uniref:DUF7146 domain-containing protein n=1 Tax=Haematobacter missouriensis TaxID=366616 RepID=UPI0023F2F1AF